MKKYLRLIPTSCFLLFFVFFIQVGLVRGLNYEPSVQVGDELIWKSQTSYSNNSIEEQYIKHEITSIYDVDEVITEVKVNSSLSSDNIGYHYAEVNATYGILENYDEYPIFILSRSYHYIVPGTKIGEYIGYFLQPTPYWDVPIESIERGYGIQFTQDNGDKTVLVFNKEGILEKYEFYNASMDKNYDQNLYSINGKIYSSKTIPGYSVWILIGWSGVIFGMILLKHVKNKDMRLNHND